MFSVWYGCKTCRRSFLKLDDLFEHKNVHPLEKRRIQSNEQTDSISPSANPSALGSRKKLSQTQTQTQHNPFVLVRRLTSQKIQNSSVSTKVISRAKYTDREKASSTLPTAKRSPNNVANFYCKLCLVKFNSDSKLTLHLNSCALSHQHRDRFCVPCNTKFHNKHNLKRHILSRHKDIKPKSKQCGHCPRKFIYESELIRHTLTHTQKKPTLKGSTNFGNQQFKCEQPHCGKTFHLRHHFTNHLSTHSDARPFTCPKAFCLTTVKTMDNLRKHIRKVHLDSKPRILETTKNCGTSFKNKLHPQKHILNHSAQGQFKCPETNCSRTFKNKESARYHIQTHSDLRPFKCPEAGCEKSFKFKVICRQHLLTHTDARPFVCFHQNCDKAYKSRGKLYLHLKGAAHCASPSIKQRTIKLQAQMRTLKSEISPQATPTKHAVNRNSRQFICKESNCGKEFSNKSNLHRHHRSIHF